MRKFNFLFGIIIIAMVMSSCNPDEVNKMTKFEFVNQTYTITEGEMVQLRDLLVIEPSEFDTVTITYASSNTAVASVDSTGLCVANYEGLTTISAKTGDYSAEMELCVKAPELIDFSVVESKEVSVNNDELIEVGRTPSGFNMKHFNITASPAENIYFQTEDNGVRVTTTKAGNYNLTVSYGEKSKTCAITAKFIEIVTIKTTVPVMQLATGESKPLEYYYGPLNASERNVTFRTDDSTIATIDAEGMVTAVAKGFTRVYVAAPNGVEDYTEVIVDNDNSPRSFSTNREEVELLVGRSAELEVALFPQNATDYTITIDYKKTGNRAIDVAMREMFSIEQSDKKATITGLSKGSGTIAVKVNNLPVKEIPVRVIEKRIDKETITSFDLQETYIQMENGSTATIHVINIKPSTADASSIQWSSSNPAIATVSKGVVTANNNGENGSCTITAQANDIKKTCIIYVAKPEVQEFTPEYTSLKLFHRSSWDEVYQLKMNITPAAAASNVLYSIVGNTPSAYVSANSTGCTITIPKSTTYGMRYECTLRAIGIGSGKTVEIPIVIYDEDYLKKNATTYYYAGGYGKNMPLKASDLNPDADKFEFGVTETQEIMNNDYPSLIPTWKKGTLYEEIPLVYTFANNLSCTAYGVRVYIRNTINGNMIDGLYTIKAQSSSVAYLITEYDRATGKVYSEKTIPIPVENIPYFKISDLKAGHSFSVQVQVLFEYYLDSSIKTRRYSSYPRICDIYSFDASTGMCEIKYWEGKDNKDAGTYKSVYYTEEQLREVYWILYGNEEFVIDTGLHGPVVFNLRFE